MDYNAQNKKIEAITERTLVIGIDVGSETHYARAFDHRGIEYSKKPFKFSNDEDGFASFYTWISEYKEQHEKDKVVPGMEPTGHTDLYDGGGKGAIPFDKLAEFYTEYLK